MRLAIAALVAVLLGGPAAASDLDELQQLLVAASQGSFEYEQTYTSVQNETTTALGSLAYDRPSRFRLEQQTPEEIVIVSDGDTLWFHDVELNQVVISDANRYAAVRGFLAVLAESDWQELFRASVLEASEGLRWLALEPYDSDDLQFSKCAVGFDESGAISVVRINDILGGLIEARFTPVPGQLTDDRFTLAIPDGAEVIQD